MMKLQLAKRHDRFPEWHRVMDARVKPGHDGTINRSFIG